ncbi:hypothetical protein CPB83DRAFT_451307 [Crepidotus variabilis]|uniref:Uncharacterized protein n=1 Tax=Crepidotus variabilis TaxID=179855 RepID=A0A9P6EC75_9AGAR|nr:hypothetical protein CPB83DRAFT_451307 [Crepidotus variabilis]
MDLDQDQNARQSVSNFLLAEFAKIRKVHLYLKSSWPSEHVIQFLIDKSSPQFILASTVVRYLNDPTSDDHPDKRLDDIIKYGATCPSEQPFNNIDNLYHFIFSGVNPKHRDKVWCILGVIHLASLRQEYTIPSPTPDFFDLLFSHEKSGAVYPILRPLASVIFIPTEPDKPMKSLHASLFDFLLEPRRSKDLVLNLAPSYLALFKLCVGQVERVLSSDATAEFHATISACQSHMSKIPAAGKALKVFNDFLDLLEELKFWKQDGTMKFFPLHELAAIYASIFKSSQVFAPIPLGSLSPHCFK